jgi:5-methylcytosine-specific restriction enzyme subunit McrC
MMINRRPLHLREYKASTGVELADTDVEAIRRLVPSMRISPTIGQHGCYDLVPGSVIGTITTNNVDIVISPKITVDRLLFLLSYTLDPQHWKPTTFQFAEAASILDAVIPTFLSLAEAALRRGLLQGYIEVEDALMSVRGRLRFDEQLRRRQTQPLPIELRWDEFTEDIEENRLLKAATRILRSLHHPRTPTYAVRLRRLEAQLDLVTAIRYDPRIVPEPVITRLNAHYTSALRLARLIIQNTTFDVRHGRVTASAVLFDMNKVFEDFVVTALRKALQLRTSEFPQGAKGHRLRLDAAHQIRLKPDISWWRKDRCLFIGDVKYKRITVEGIAHPNLYQLLAYTVAARLRNGLLIYAAGESVEVTHTVPPSDTQLHIRTLDLSGSPAQILDQVNNLACIVKSLAAQIDQAGTADAPNRARVT